MYHAVLSLQPNMNVRDVARDRIVSNRTADYILIKAVKLDSFALCSAIR